MEESRVALWVDDGAFALGLSHAVVASSLEPTELANFTLRQLDLANLVCAARAAALTSLSSNSLIWYQT